jgi:hypothetical protein
MAGKKTFNNKSNQTINVTLLVRQGTDIQKPSLEEFFTIGAGESKIVTYGNSSNIFLNGLVFEWKDQSNKSLNTDKQEVTDTGSAPTFDWVLNTHSVININSAKGLDISANN